MNEETIIVMLTGRTEKAAEFDGQWYPVTRNALNAHLLLPGFYVKIVLKNIYGKWMVTAALGARDRFGWDPENHPEPNF